MSEYYPLHLTSVADDLITARRWGSSAERALRVGMVNPVAMKELLLRLVAEIERLQAAVAK